MEYVHALFYYTRVELSLLIHQTRYTAVEHITASVITIANQWLWCTGRFSDGLANRWQKGYRLRRLACFGAISVCPSDLFQPDVIRLFSLFSFFFLLHFDAWFPFWYFEVPLNFHGELFSAYCAISKTPSRHLISLTYFITWISLLYVLRTPY